MPTSDVDLRCITGGRNLAVLAAAPGDESLYCGSLIAEAARRGRPPFVAILTDGSRLPIPGLPAATPDEIARRHGQACLAATAALGVPDDWVVVLGLHDGSLPVPSPRFSSVVSALSAMLWRRDCNAIAVPWAADRRPDHAAAHAAGLALARQDGIALIAYRTTVAGTACEAPPFRLRPGPAAACRTAAIAAHRHLTEPFDEAFDLLG